MSTAKTPRQRQPRTLAQKLGSIVLGSESLVVFLAGLTVFGLKALPDGVADWWGIVGGAVVAVLLVATAGMISRRWSFALGWALQGVIALAAILVPAILFVALIFGGLWGYATIGGARMDARMSAVAKETHTESE